MTNNKHLDAMYNNSNNKKQSGEAHTITRMHPSMKRPRAPIACYRCHHKKVRCDGIHPNCTRCQSTGILCAYPSSRRSRNTQPTNVDPFIDNLSQLEALIRRIETDLESQRQLLRTVCASTPDLSDNRNHAVTEKSSSTLTSRMLKTEKDLQESRSIVAQLRLRGEQRAARGRRAAAAAAAAAASTGNAEKGSASYTGKRKSSSMSTSTASTTASNTGKQRGCTKQSKQSIKKEVSNQISNHNNADYNADVNNLPHYATNTSSPPFYFGTPSPNEFIHPTSTLYFPYPSNLNNNDSSMCNSNNNLYPSAATFAMTGSFQDWNHLLGDLPHSTATAESGFVDPMILAAASEAHQNAPPILSVSNYNEDNSIMANKARALSHSPPTTSIALPGLQPSSSSTSTNSSASYNYSPYEGYNQFMGGDEMMIDTQNN